MLSRLTNQSRGKLSVDSSVAQGLVFCAVTLCFQKNMAVTAVNC